MDARFRPRVIIGDCLTEMPKLGSARFDLILTSPPYGIGKEYEDAISNTAYMDFARQWTALVPSLLKPTGSFWLNTGYRSSAPYEAVPLSYLYWQIRPHELRLRQEIIWNFKSGNPLTGRFSNRHETLQWFVVEPFQAHLDMDQVRMPHLKPNSNPRNNPLGRNPGSVWPFKRTAGGRAAGPIKRATGHPCIWPEALVERVLLACCPPGGRVLDPFAGTGTVGRVAERLGMESVLIEQNPRYLYLGEDCQSSNSASKRSR